MTFLWCFFILLKGEQDFRYLQKNLKKFKFEELLNFASRRSYSEKPMLSTRSSQKTARHGFFDAYIFFVAEKTNLRISRHNLFKKHAFGNFLSFEVKLQKHWIRLLLVSQSIECDWQCSKMCASIKFGAYCRISTSSHIAELLPNFFQKYNSTFGE